MIKINKKRGTVSEVEEKPPSIQNWIQKKKKKLDLSDIISIEVQLKDIKQMKNSKNYRLQTLYHLTDLTKQEEDYIVLSKYKRGTTPYIRDLMRTSWLISKEEIEQKSIFALEQDCLQLMEVIKRKNDRSTRKLLEYKLYCLEEYLLQRKLQENIKEYSLKKGKN